MNFHLEIMNGRINILSSYFIELYLDHQIYRIAGGLVFK